MARQSQLTGVTSLQMTYSPNAGSPRLEASNVHPISFLFPNLVSVDLSGLNVSSPVTICALFAQRCPQLSQLTWDGCNDENGLSLDGAILQRAACLTELFLDNGRFCVEHGRREFSDPSNTDIYMLCRCRHLERLSIKNASCQFIYDEGAQPVSQEILIKMVRLHPTLRWIRSDLSPANIAMLQQERPEIIFVSD